MYLVTKLNHLDSKLDTVLRILSTMSTENTAAQPELPNGISLPVSTIGDLEAVEGALAQNSSLKDCLVSS